MHHGDGSPVLSTVCFAGASRCARNGSISKRTRFVQAWSAAGKIGPTATSSTNQHCRASAPLASRYPPATDAVALQLLLRQQRLAGFRATPASLGAHAAMLLSFAVFSIRRGANFAGRDAGAKQPTRSPYNRRPTDPAR